MLEGNDDPQLQAEGELSLARMALDSGDLNHAANHLAGAVAWSPGHPEVRELMGQLVREHGAATPDLFDINGSAFIGTVVARAYALGSLGQHAEAFQLLVSASAYDPSMPWAEVDWMSDPHIAEAIHPEITVRAMMRLATALADPVTDPAVRAASAPYLTFVSNAVAAHSYYGLLIGVASSISRRAGSLEQALAWSTQAVQTDPTAMTELYLASVYRSMKQVDAAAQAFERAIAHDPLNLALYSDLAELYATHQQLPKALQWIDKAMAIDPDYDCVVHVGQRLRFEQDHDARHLIQLADFASAHPGSDCNHEDLTAACWEEPWLGFVPASTESCTNLLSHAVEQKIEGPITMSVSSFEPPSAITAITRTFPGSSVTTGPAPGADPHRPLRTVRAQVWTPEGQPAVAPPSQRAVAALQQTAQFRLGNPPAAYDHAVSLAGLSLDDLLGVLVHPVAPPSDGDIPWHDYPALWIRVVQTWACLGMLHHQADEPWQTSARREVLVDLTFGAEDWVTETALFALITAAWVDQSSREDVANVVRERFEALRSAYAVRPVTIAPSLARLALLTPQIDGGTREFAAEILAETDD